MSFGNRFKILAHIVTDSKEAADLVDALNTECYRLFKFECGDHIDLSEWDDYSRKTESGYDETEAEFSMIVSGAPYQKLDELLSEIAALNNGSYGLLLADTDFGVAANKCYGNAAFTELPAEEAAGYWWATDTDLLLEKKCKTAFIAKLLNCSTEDDVSAEADEQMELLSDLIVPKLIKDILYDERDPHVFDHCDAYEENDELRLVFELSSHSYTTEQLDAVKDLFANGLLEGWTLRLREAEKKDNVYENIMISTPNNAFAVYNTSCGVFDIRYYVFRATTV